MPACLCASTTENNFPVPPYLRSAPPKLRVVLVRLLYSLRITGTSTMGLVLLRWKRRHHPRAPLTGRPGPSPDDVSGSMPPNSNTIYCRRIGGRGVLALGAELRPWRWWSCPWELALGVTIHELRSYHNLSPAASWAYCFGEHHTDNGRTGRFCLALTERRHHMVRKHEKHMGDRTMVWLHYKQTKLGMFPIHVVQNHTCSIPGCGSSEMGEGTQIQYARILRA